MESFQYDIDKAVIITSQNLSPRTRLCIDEEDVRTILEMFFLYLRAHGFTIEDDETEQLDTYKEIIETPELYATDMCPWVYEISEHSFSLDILYEVFDAEICYYIISRRLRWKMGFK